MDLISVLVVFLVTLLAFGAMLYAYGVANLEEIKDNWVQYRCNPIYMPMADLVGSDIFTNFTNCTLQATQSYAGVALDPIYKNFTILTDTVNMIMDSMNDMRAAITGASDGFLSIIQNTFAKIQNTMNTTTQLFARIRTIINRLMATMAVIMNIVNTGIQTGQSIQNGPIGQAAEFFCFDPYTLISTRDGLIPMCGVRAGMKLADGQVVQSVLEFDGHATQMFTIGSIRVSGNHKIVLDGKWIRVEDHPLAEAAESCDRLFCLNTEKHTIPIGGFVFKDYEETSDPEILAEFFRRVEEHYGAFSSSKKKAAPEKFRLTGVLPTTSVILEDRSIVNASQVRIGDSLKYGGDVTGIVHHSIKGLSTYKEVGIAPGTWIVNGDEGVVPITEIHNESTTYTYIQFLTDSCHYAVASPTGEFVILDDHEVDDDEVHKWRDSEVQKEMI
jgi:hypothetical protein